MIYKLIFLCLVILFIPFNNVSSSTETDTIPMNWKNKKIPTIQSGSLVVSSRES